MLDNNPIHTVSGNDYLAITSSSVIGSKRWGMSGTTVDGAAALWRGYRDTGGARSTLKATAACGAGPSRYGGGSFCSGRGVRAAGRGHTSVRGGRRPARASSVGVLMMAGGGVWDLQDEEEWEFEDEVQRLERRLENAIEKEDYGRAAKARDKLYRCGVALALPIL